MKKEKDKEEGRGWRDRYMRACARSQETEWRRERGGYRSCGAADSGIGGAWRCLLWKSHTHKPSTKHNKHSEPNKHNNTTKPTEHNNH